MKALLVIDMQNGSFTTATPRYEADNVVDKINALAKQLRQTGDVVIFIQHDGTRDNDFLPGTHNWQMLPQLIVAAGDILISKTANDCFYQSTLDDTLKKLGVNEVYITGCATDFCVDTTIRSALAKDYHVTVIEDAHTTADRPHMAAEKVIEHHNWVWQNMIPTNGTIRVIKFEAV